MKTLLNKLRIGAGRHIIVVGDVMLDEYVFGSVARISPEAPVPVLRQERREWSLGGAANVAANCRHIGCDVTLIGLVNEHDEKSLIFESLLKELSISSAGIVRTPHRPTTCKKRFLAQTHQLLRVDNEAAYPLTEKEFADITQRVKNCIKPSSVILISDYAKGVVSKGLITFLCAQARLYGCTIMVDPKGPDFEKYHGADYLKPNTKEFEQMVAFFGLPTNRSLEENGRAICELLSLKGLVVTLGEKGILYITKDQSIYSPAHKQEVYDLTGAGDTVIAFLALGIACDLSMEECLHIANRAAAVAIAHVKTYAVSLDELIDSATETAEKIFHDWATLKIELDWLRADGKRVVFTNGTFDILHPGHIHVLKEAKKQGDILVVALNTDASVKRYKGNLRPINNLEYRSTMMSAIGFVDFVVSFEQDTPQELIAYLRPDVLVKGGDYKKEKVAGYDVVTSYGGLVHIVDYIVGCSTTGVIKKVRENSSENQAAG